MPTFKAGDGIRMLSDCGGTPKKGEELTVRSGYSHRLHVIGEDGGYCECQDKWQLVAWPFVRTEETKPSMKTWETLTVGDKVKTTYYVHTILAVVDGLYALSASWDAEVLSHFVTIKTLKEDFTIVQDTPNTIDINGKKYNKDAVMERLEELDPIE